MEESQKLLENKEDKLIYPHRCPVCDIETTYIYRMEDGKTHERSDWYRCQCGVIFQDEYPESKKVYDDKYVAQLAEGKQAQERYEYLLRLYAPLIEELTYGRMMLEVGFCVPYILKAFEQRGWLTWAIDINPALTGKGNIYKGDFLTYDFSLSGERIKETTGEDKINRKFDLIWAGHTIEHVPDPISFLKRAYNLLDPKGVLFLSTPDIEFINKTGIAGWPHFKKQEHYVLWSEGALRRELERLGFKVVMMRRNFSSRFMSWWDLHVIAQKNYF